MTKKYETPLIWKDGHAEIDPAMAFTFHSQFGIPPEYFEDMVNKELPIGSSVRRIMVVRAYDNAHGTNWSEKSMIIEKKIAELFPN